MTDDSAGRIQVPGQQPPAPERDVEPLWPAEELGQPVPPRPPDAATGQPAPAGPAAPDPGRATATWAPGSGWGAAGSGWGDPGTAAVPAAGWGQPAAASAGNGRAEPPVQPPLAPQPTPAQSAPPVQPVPPPAAAPAAESPPPTGQEPPPAGADAPPGPEGRAWSASESPWAQPPNRTPTGPAGDSDDDAPVPPAPADAAPTAPADVPPAPESAPHPAGIPGDPPPEGWATPPGWAPPPPVGGWAPGWQQPHPGVVPIPQQPYQQPPGVVQVPPAAGHPDPAAVHPDPTWRVEGAPPTAEDFARRRASRPPEPVATMGIRAVVNRTGLVRLRPGRHEQEIRRDIEMVRRNFGGLRQVTVVNPKGGAGKTVAILLLAMTFGQKRGGYVLAWDNNETQGTLGMRAQQDFHSRTVRDLLRDLGQFQSAHGRVGDLSQYVRSQGEGMFDVLASDESATGGEMLTATAFAEIREVVSRFYKLIFVDTGNNVRAQNWQAAMDATDQLVVTMSARNDSAETAARMLDHLEQSGRQRLVRQAVTVVSMPPSRKEIDLPAIRQHFAARTRAVLLAPYERLIDSGEPIRYGELSTATRDAWLKIAAAVAEGL